LNYPEGSTGFKTLFKSNEQHRIPANKIAQVCEGFEIASHGYKHEALGMIKAEQMEESILLDIAGLSKLTGCPIVGHAYPGGSSSDEVAACRKNSASAMRKKCGGAVHFHFQITRCDTVRPAWCTTKSCSNWQTGS
jgi:peptidoglycan/xylan/chitin deacetylase (PgdA/CDA1 family)